MSSLTIANWFTPTNENLSSLRDYAEPFVQMAENNLIGDKVNANMLTQRYLVTNYALESFSQAVFITINAIFSAVVKAGFSAFRLDFDSARTIACRQESVVLESLEVAVTLIALIIFGVISPDRAYKDLSEQLQTKLEASRLQEQELPQEPKPSQEGELPHAEGRPQEEDPLQPLPPQVEGLSPDGDDGAGATV